MLLFTIAAFIIFNRFAQFPYSPLTLLPTAYFFYTPNLNPFFNSLNLIILQHYFKVERNLFPSPRCSLKK